MKNALSLTLLLAFQISVAQLPEQRLAAWAETSPIEKIHLHLDRQEYTAGQTIWFKAYLYNEFLPSLVSSNLFLELTKAGKIIQRMIFPVSAGISIGQIDLPDTSSSGNYIIRAYTSAMLNFDHALLYSKIIYVTGKTGEGNSKVPEDLKLNMYPEGGYMLKNFPATIAFKATDQYGLPRNVKGVIKNNSGSVVTAFETYHDGLGMFELEAAQVTDELFAEITDQGVVKKFPLPKAESNGIVFRMMNGNGTLHFEIMQGKGELPVTAGYMVGHMQHRIVFRQEFTNRNSFTGTIDTKKLPAGILHVTIFSASGVPLAERLCFIDNGDYRLNASLFTDTLNTNPRAKNNFSISLPDTVKGSFSISISDDNYVNSDAGVSNIYSDLLLSGDLKGYIHNAGWYFTTAAKDSAAYALDLLMMTHGWSRFKWEQAYRNQLPRPEYKDAGFIKVSGKVLLQGTKKPFASNNLLAYILSADSSRSMQLISTDQNGEFLMDSLVFFGKSSIMLSDIKGKKSRFVDIKLNSDSLHRPFNITAAGSAANPYAGRYEMIAQLRKKLADEYAGIAATEGMVLSEIVLTSRKKTALEQLEEKYISGAFAAESRRTFDFVNTTESMSYTSIYDFLNASVPGITAGTDADGNYVIYYRQASSSLSSLGLIPMEIFIDEVPADASMVAFLAPSQIALIKVYSSFAASTGNGAGGVLAIYMRKGEDMLNTANSAGEVFTYNGYSSIKEFYSPDYSKQTAAKIDHRLTLQWIPDLVVQGKKKKIPFSFYNNDRTKSFRVIVEGMTNDGRLVYINQVVR